mmetsp:Transcript_9202/g.37895  ORF Transcript_9202/g.37895 Transcript_9202/m.37895 type:complete len:248 (+) Transcript_9202:143-886(+)
MLRIALRSGGCWRAARASGSMGVAVGRRGVVGEAASENKKAGREKAWEKVQFLAYDVPDLSLPFEERLKKLQALEENEVLRVAKYTKCRGREHLQEELEAAVARGADGLILRDPKAMYKYGKDVGLLKVKKMYESQVLMVEKSPTTRGLIVQVPSGKTQMVRCSKHEYEKSTPARGSVLSVGHFGQWKSTGRYKYPYLVAIRPELSWEEVLQTYAAEQAELAKEEASRRTREGLDDADEEEEDPHKD